MILTRKINGTLVCTYDDNGDSCDGCPIQECLGRYCYAPACDAGWDLIRINDAGKAFVRGDSEVLDGYINCSKVNLEERGGYSI